MSHTLSRRAFGVVSLAGTPEDAIKALSEALQKVIADPYIKQKLLGLSATPVGSDSAGLARHVLAERAKWKPIGDGELRKFRIFDILRKIR